MDDDAERTEEAYPLTKAGPKFSTTPSWVMVGFVFGALTVFAMMRTREPVAPAATAAAPTVVPAVPVEPRPTPLLTTIEAVFELWGQHAVWHANTTEVALWNKQEGRFADCYEVRRSGGVLYFRSIPHLTRRVIRHGKELTDSPLQFTETEEQYREWLEHGRRERPAEPTSPVNPAAPGPKP